MREEIEQSFVAAGWKITDCSSRDLLVGYSDNVSILAYEFLTRTEDPHFELRDSKWYLSHWVRVIPSPRVAAVLLEEHGEPL
jgi:hypothetical protein